MDLLGIVESRSRGLPVAVVAKSQLLVVRRGAGCWKREKLEVASQIWGAKLINKSAATETNLRTTRPLETKDRVEAGTRPHPLQGKINHWCGTFQVPAAAIHLIAADSR